MMIERKRGLIVNISSFAGMGYVFNVAYGVGKAAVDRMAQDMAVELKPHGITCVSLWPGVVRTEQIVQFHAEGRTPFEIENGESPRFAGRAVAAVAADENCLEKTGKVLICYELAHEYGFTDIDGRQPGDIFAQMA
jgi:dehydrogenase/reductase SDR family protein 1